MAWTNSKMFAAFVADTLAGTAAFDLNSDSFKAALFDNTITPSNSVGSSASAYNTGVWLTAAEVDDGTEWDAAGEPVANPTLTATGTDVKFDADNVQSGGTSATLASVYGCLVYDDTLATPVADQGICYNYFGGAQSVTDGIFTIQWSATGIASISVA